MLAVRVIPCLDVDAGRVVKGVRFVELRDAGDPVELAARYDAEGADELVFLDITASSDDARHDGARRRAGRRRGVHPVHGRRRRAQRRRRAAHAARRRRQGLAQHRRDRTIPRSLRPGADEFGAQCIVVAIDARRRNADDPGAAGRSRRTAAARPTGLDAIEWAVHACDLGAGEILLTSMDRDGTKAGYDLELLRAIGDAVNVPVIASGGVGTLEHLYEGVADGGASAVLAASIFHFGQHTVREAKDYLAARGLPVRRAVLAVPDQRRRAPVHPPVSRGYRDRTVPV